MFDKDFFELSTYNKQLHKRKPRNNKERVEKERQVKTLADAKKENTWLLLAGLRDI